MHDGTGMFTGRKQWMSLPREVGESFSEEMTSDVYLEGWAGVFQL